MLHVLVHLSYSPDLFSPTKVTWDELSHAGVCADAARF